MIFSNWLYEDLKVPNQDDGFGKMRHTMPQLPDFAAFVADLEENNIEMATVSVNPWLLTPTQKNFNEEKVDRLVETDLNAKPIIISKDKFVLDGHHRWLAAAKKKINIRARKVDLSIDELLEFLKGKPYVEKRTISE